MNKQLLRVISFNGNGIFNPAKRSQILSKIQKKKKAQVALARDPSYPMGTWGTQGSIIHQAIGEVEQS